MRHGENMLIVTVTWCWCSGSNSSGVGVVGAIAVVLVWWEHLQWCWCSGSISRKIGQQNRSTQKNPVPLPLRPPHIPHGMAQDRTQTGNRSPELQNIPSTSGVGLGL